MTFWCFLSLLAILLLLGLHQGWMRFQYGDEAEGGWVAADRSLEAFGALGGCWFMVAWFWTILDFFEGVNQTTCSYLLAQGWLDPLATLAGMVVAVIFFCGWLFLTPVAYLLSLWTMERLADGLLWLRLSALLAEVQSPQVEERIRAARRLQIVRPRARAAVPLLVRSLNAADEPERWAAAFALAAIEPGSLVPFLPWILTNFSDGWLRQQAGRLVERLGPASHRFVPPLLAALEKPRQKKLAARVLRRFGLHCQPALPQVIDALATGTSFQRRTMAKVLTQCGPQAEPATTALCKALEDGDPGVRRHAALALERIGQVAHAAVPALVGTLWDHQESVCQAAARALVQIGQSAVTDLVVALLDAKEAFVRKRAARILGQIGSYAQAAVPALRLATQDADAGVAHAARQALERVHPWPEE